MYVFFSQRIQLKYKELQQQQRQESENFKEEINILTAEILNTKQDTYWFLIRDTQRKTRHLLVFYLRYSTQNKTLTGF
jgi:alkylhydroperoxidase/carboxymuconolactone decarboxylase family protein YurZ